MCYVSPGGILPAGGFCQGVLVLVLRQTAFLTLLAVLVTVAPTRAGHPFYDHDRSTDLAVGALGVGLFGAGFLLDRTSDPLTPAEIAALEPVRLNRLDRTAVDNWSPGADQASDYLVSASIAAPLTLLFSEPGRDQSGVIGVMYLETMLLNSGLTYLLKNTVARPRPYVYSSDSEVPLALQMSRTSRRSFPSGHTSRAFASLVFLATVHDRLHPGAGANDWIWGACLATAATTGYLRYAAGKHFPTDILAGAAIGGFAGWVVPRWHEWEAAPSDPNEKSGPGRETIVGVRLAF